MKYLKDTGFNDVPFGILVTLEQIDLDHPAYETRKTNAYRTELTVMLPANQQNRWIDQVVSILDLVQDGNAWTVHFLWDNVAEFFTTTQLQIIENAFRVVAFRCHAAPPLLYMSSDTKEMARIERHEQSYQKKKARQRRNYRRDTSVSLP